MLGKLLSGMGASQSVRTLRMLASMKAIWRSALRSWVITTFSIDIFFVAGILIRETRKY